MALLRCPACNRKGEVPGHDPHGRYRCPHCGHAFVAGEASSTQEHDIFADESPAFVHETSIEPGDLPLHPRWRRWIGRLADHCHLEPSQVIVRALALFARESGFHEPPPAS
jgi:hypothetical protein